MSARLSRMAITCRAPTEQKKWCKRPLSSLSQMLRQSSCKTSCAIKRLGCSSFLHLLESTLLERMDRSLSFRQTKSSLIWIALFLKPRMLPTQTWSFTIPFLVARSSPRKSPTGGTGPPQTSITSRESTTKTPSQTASQTTI